MNHINQSCILNQNQTDFFMTSPKIYLINLDRSIVRYKAVSNKLNATGIEYERFSAIDGYKINITNTQNNQSFLGESLKGVKLNPDVNYIINCLNDGSTQLHFYGWNATPGELGCWCSHYILWSNVATTKENVIIFEDDMFPLNIKTFNSQMMDFVNHLPESFDVGFMDFNHIVEGKKTKLDDNPLISVPNIKFSAWGAHAYVISPKGANKLLAYPSYNEIEDVFIWDKFNLEELEVYISTLDFVGVGMQPSILSQMGRH